MTLRTNHVINDTGHTDDHNAIATQVNQNTSDIAANKGLPVGATGATQPTRYVGRWAATGAPASGTFAVGDFGFDGTNAVQICTVAGTPGTWAGSAASSAPLLDRGNWTTSTTYAVNDTVTQSGQRYVCATAHTGGTFATDLAAGKWVAVDAVQAAPAQESVNTVGTSGATQTIPDPVTAQSVSRITLSANCTLTFPTAGAGKSFTLVLVQDATGSRLVTWPGAIKWASATAPTLTTANSKADVVSFLCADGTNWLGFVSGQNF